LLIIFISVNIINILSGKPNEPSGVSTTTGNDENKGISEYVISDVKISDDDFNVPVQSGFVSPDEPQIRIGNTYINFSPYNLEGTKEVKVKRLNQISDSEKGFTIQAYDFEIEGISEFNVPVYIEMPYYPVIEDNLYEESTIFVQYYNENESKWEMIPSWINAEANTVAIPNAMNTRFKLAQIWPARLKPLMGFSKNNKYLFQISRGDGKLLPFEDEA
jgi:hypothetical protein